MYKFNEHKMAKEMTGDPFESKVGEIDKNDLPYRVKVPLLPNSECSYYILHGGSRKDRLKDP